MERETANFSTDVIFQSLNPATGELLHNYDLISDSLLDQKIYAAVKAYEEHRKKSFSQRAQILETLADKLENNATTYGKMITAEMGKPVDQGIKEIQKCALVCRYYAENGERFLQDKEINSQNATNWVAYEPLGVIFSVMPWNFPFWQVFRFAAPALMAGNAILLKHAENVPQCAETIEHIFSEILPNDGLLQNLFITHEQAARVIKNKDIRGITLTGSDAAGAKVAAEAGKNLKRTVLELGGSDPFIVLEDADIDQAVQTGLQARIMNSGQSCIAAKRFILHHRISDEFLEKFSAQMKELTIGNPLLEDVDIGPLARADLVDKLHHQVVGSIQKGASLIQGGEKMRGKGNFFEPGILINIPETAPAYKEELFGPVASVFTVKDENEAVKLANDTEYGLGASVWTEDPQRAVKLGKDIETGSVYINTLVKSHPTLPFGGVKNSGYGRELSEEGIKEFTNIKTYFIA